MAFQSQTQTMVQEPENQEEHLKVILKKRPDYLKKDDWGTKLKSCMTAFAPGSVFTDDEKKEADSLGNNPERLEYFRKKFQAKSQKMQQNFAAHINQMQKQFEEELPNMTEAQAMEAFTWWSAVSDFFSSVMEAFVAMINKVIEKIKEGYQWIKKKIKEAIEYFTSAIKQIFG
eukprot:CAMPEP_0201567306 /NCGR_PEP_ID=MMETSP0190_2-20130828/7765_1 /ASSEMBLY_ACC=CAM_ASM_000263 /TAXON_ID=37353 /ORGANISM="Rosalina sp." /LENGTH=172 /DNA_ID=CAMNT_0047987151 /DNA_START=87 /DNA_END=605 /DNA_ORIENTATION=-